ncbi:hemagglutinin [Methylobacterium sp. C25]|uniref:Ig-like domain-containing protein n=1 Tax=Methylobacterium sp. C25 TaxID=2721622 RepID=UPI001F3F14A6|nr:Ig-like domain-containing protein [Methylobacterium sp. C25]MCE4226781.1 hemagglutinin [Methylobacterium sp. C25]
MAVTQTFESSVGLNGNPITIGGFIYTQRTSSTATSGNLVIQKELLSDAALFASSGSGYLSISQTSGAAFDLNSLSINRDIALLPTTFIVGYRNGVQVGVYQDTSLLNLGEHNVTLGGPNWQGLTEVRIFNANSLLDVSVGVGFGIDNVNTTDAIAPGAPTLSAGVGATADNTPTVTGTAEIGSTVTIYDGATAIGTTTAGANGLYAFTPTTALSDGAHNLSARATDASGNVSLASPAASLRIDTVAPTAPVLAAGTGLSNSHTPAITGTAEAGSTVTILNGATVLGSTVAAADGTFSFKPAVGLADGNYVLTATAVDAVGNTSIVSSAIGLRIDSVAPGAPAVTAFTGPTNNTAPVITGTAEAGSTVTISDNGTVLGTTVAAANGTFSFTPTAALAQGANSFTATARDAAGNVSVASAAVALTIDTTAPTAPVIKAFTGPTNSTTPAITGTAEAGATVTISDNGGVIGTTVAGANGAFSFTPTVALAAGNNSFTATARDAAGNVSGASAAVALTIDTTAPVAPVLAALTGPTNNTSPTITGTAEAGSTVTISENGTVLGTAVAGANGAFSFTPATALAAGANSFTATARDAAGNVSGASAAVALTIDTTAPGAPVIAAFTGPTNHTTPTITGTAEAGATVTISDNGTVLGTAVAGANGTFSFTPTTALAQGANSFTATARDVAGNLSAASAAVALTIDTTAPGAPAITPFATPTNNPTPTITGTAEAGATVTIFNGTTVVGTVTAGANGSFSLTPTVPLPHGTATLTATAQDAAGNLSVPSAAATVVIDTHVPGAPVVNSIAPTNDTTPDITGTGNAGDTIIIKNGGATVGTGTVAANGTFSVTVTTALPEGNSALSVTATSPGGTVSPAAPVTVLVDTTNPLAPVITAFTGPTNDTTPTITGTAEAGTTVTISNNGAVLGTAVAGANGTFSFTPATALAAGTANLTATAKDAAGNLSSVSATTSVTIDTTAPDTPALNPFAGPINTSTPTITGHAEVGSTVVTITAGGTIIGTAVTAADGSFSLTPAQPLPDGVSTLTATARDAAGNLSAVSAPLTVTIDTHAPGAPSITAFAGPTNSTTPTITGTAEAGATVTISDNGTVIGTALAGANGAFSFTPATALAAGANSLTATAQDVAGNVSAGSAAVILTIDTLAPAAPVIAAFSGPTNNTAPTITGTSEAGSTVTISDNGTVLGTAVAGANGIFSFTPASALPEGANSLSATARDAAGNLSGASAAVALTIDTAAPGAPVITAFAGPTNHATPSITGTAEAGSTVTISDNGTVLGTAVAGADGAFSFTPTAPLADGVNSFTATARDAAGNLSGVSAAAALTIDTAAPGAPAIAAFTGPTNDSTPTITGTAEAGAIVTVFSGTTVLGTVTAGANGSFSLTPTVPLPDGTASLTATARDAAGNLSASSAATSVVIDTHVPGAPVVNFLAPTNDTTPIITGTGNAGDTITVSNGGTPIGTGTVASDGSFSVTVTTPLTEGSSTLTVTATSASGTVSAAAPVTVLVDTTDPVAPVIAAFSGPTNDTTPTITGTAEAGTTITILNDGAVLGTAVAGPDGSFSFTPTAALQPGTANLTATATDAAGNVSPVSTAASLTIDTSAPSVPTLTPFSGPINTATPTITGHAEAGSTVVTITADGTVIGTVVSAPDGSFSLTPTQPLPDGVSTLSASARDAAGNLSAVSAPLTVTIDTHAPDAPSIATFTGPTNSATPTITGTAEAGATVTISDNGTVLGTALAGADGTFSFTPGSALGEGLNTLSATAHDAAGNASAASAAVALTIDTAAPGAPTISAFTGPTSDSTPTITGAAEAGTTVTVLSGTTVLGTVTAGADGSFSLTPTVPLPDGTASLTATARDAAGNLSAVSGAVALVIDTHVPGAPVVDFVPPTNDTTPVISGTGNAGYTITISNGGAPIGTGTVAPDGSFSVTVTTALPEGSSALTVTATSPGGTLSPAAPVTVLVDTTVPVAPGITAFTGPNNDATPTITGTAEAGTTVTISNNGAVLGTVVAGPDGSFSFTPTADLPQGTANLTATATDAAGNVSPTSAATTLTIDTSAPSIPTLTAFPGPVNDATPTITGHTEAGSTVVTITSGGTVIGTAVTAADGSFSLTPTVPLPDGTSTLIATARDAAGNLSAVSDPLTVTIDTLAPGAPVVAAFAGPINSTTPTITGSAEAGATVTISDNGSVIGTVIAGTDGAFSFTPTSALSAGVNSITAVAHDAAGNASGVSAAVDLTIDTTGPSVPVITAFTAPTNITTPTITGTAEAGATVTISDNGAVIGSAVAGADGTFSFSPTNALTEGVNHFTATAQDIAGNLSGVSASVSLTIDLTAPASPVIAAFASPTNDATPTITGTAEAGSTVTISDNGTVIGTALAGSDGIFIFVPTGALADGTSSFTATAQDAAGNVSQPSAAVALSIDTLAPAAPVIADIASPSNLATPTITGTAEAGATVTISDNGTVIGTAVAGVDGTFSFTPTTALAEGANSLTAVAQDIAGNASSASAAVALTIDTIAPIAPVIANATGPTNDATPTITGTAEAGSTVTISDNGSVLGTVLAGADGTFSFTPTSDLAGSNSFTAVAHDAAGNISPASAAVVLTIDTTLPDAPVIAGFASPTNDTTPDITGSAVPGSTVTISENGTVIGTALAGQDGGFSFTLASALTDGTYSLTATATDALGHVSGSSVPVALTIDTVAPDAPVIADFATPTNDPAPAITGTAEAGSTVTISDNGTVLGTAVAGADGTFSFTPATALADGLNTLTATAHDAAGNLSGGSAAVALTIDTLAPVAPVIAAFEGPTNDTTPTITGTAEAGATVTISDNGTVLGTAIAGSDGTFSFTPGTELALGNNSFTAVAQDAAGNSSTGSDPVNVVIEAGPPVGGDTTAPDAPVLTAPAGPTNQATPEIAGTAEAGSTVSIWDDANLLGTAVAGADGKFVVRLAHALPEGTADLTATATDAAGNVSNPSEILSVVIDLTAPGTPVITAGSGETQETTPPITGSGEAGTTVTLWEGSTQIGSAVVDPDGTFTVRPDAPLTEGGHNLALQLTDEAGNSSATAPIDVTVVAGPGGGTTAPVLVGDVNQEVAHAPAVSGNLLSNDTGTGLKVTSVQFADGVQTPIPETGTVKVVGQHGTLIVGADGSYSYQAIGATNIIDGAHAVEHFTYTATDASGATAQSSLDISLTGQAPAESASFDFAFTDAKVMLAGEALVLVGPDGVTRDISGIDALHFTDGDIQNNDGHQVVDDVYYYANNLDVWRAHVDADVHYETYGWKEGRDPNPYFHTQEYLAANPDVAAAGVNPLEHYLTYGEHEGRSTGSDFSAAAYLASNPDVAAAGLNALYHYLTYGPDEGRSALAGQDERQSVSNGGTGSPGQPSDPSGPSGSEIDPNYHPGTAPGGSAQSLHDFDAGSYLARYPDVAAAVPAGSDPATFALQHYLTFGASEHRDPNAVFDTAYYLQQNPDVAASGINPLLHYETYGWHEGRNPSASFNTNAYLASHPDVAQSGIDPLEHYLQTSGQLSHAA